MKIALFGGTFDPPHIGHYQIINKCISICDKLIIMPSKISPQKSNSPIASDKDRLNMLEIMCSTIKGDIIVDHYEINSNKVPSYTIDTVNYIMCEHSPLKLYLVMGKDQYINFENWNSYEDILSKTTIICVNRPQIKGDLGYECIFIDDINCTISSSGVRSEIGNDIELAGKSISSEVYNYIKDKELYK